jgi:hypothetical protein
MAGSFVWLKIEQPMKHGPLVTCEKWNADLAPSVRARREVVAEHKLSDAEYGLAMEILKQRYPAPKIEAQS